MAEQLKIINSVCSQPLTNQGRGLDEVAERQRRRKITLLRESCKRALWFTDSFNVDIINLLVKTRTTDEQLTIDITPSSSSTPSTSSVSQSSSSDMVYQVLYLLDRFAISDQFYHELSMVHTSLPRSYKIKEARQRINSNVELIRLPQPYYGCYRPFKNSLMEAVLAEVSLCIHVCKSIKVND